MCRGVNAEGTVIAVHALLVITVCVSNVKRVVSQVNLLRVWHSLVT